MLGLWNAVKAGVSMVKDTVSSVGGAVVEGVKVVSDKVKSGGSKVYSSISGKKYFDEAERLYEKIESRFKYARRRYEIKISERSNEIRDHLQRVNKFKERIYTELFRKFLDVANRLHRVEVVGKYFKEFLAEDIFDCKEFEVVQSRAALFEIDFNDMSFGQAAYSILTLGFYSRKKAKQSLQQVKDEEQRVNEEIAKMESRITKAEQVVLSLSNVVIYFESIVANYVTLLQRFEFGVNSQRIIRAGQSSFDKLGFRMMPIRHIEDFHALFNLSVVMKEMSSMGYISESGELIEHDLAAIDTFSRHTATIQAA